MASLTGGLTVMENRFPEIDNNKIDTQKFLRASEEVVKLVEKLGTVFAPVKADMRNNIEKLYKLWGLNQVEHQYLQDMLLLEQVRNENFGITSLLWLRRALHCFLRLFEQVVDDHKNGTKSENLSIFLKEAYIETLEPFHGWVTRNLFCIIYRMCPNRLQFFNYLSDSNDEEKIISELAKFNTSLRTCIANLIEFYKEHNLENTDRV